MTEAKLTALLEKLAIRQDKLSISQDKTDAQIDRVSKQLGEMGNKFGSFTEGMADPSLKKLLVEKFGAEFVADGVVRRRGGDSMELDVMGYTNGKSNRVFVAEVKSRLCVEDLEEFVGTLEKVPKFFPEHRGKEVIGILAAVDIPADMPKRVAKAGIHLARISDETFRLVDPKGFRAKSFAA